jgi:hypothetical protein
MLVSAQIRFHKLQPVRVFFSEQRFRDGFYNVIQPDDKQKAKIDDLLSKYAKLNGDLQDNFRKSIDSVMKEFWKELEPSLTKDQLDRIKQMEKRRMEMGRQYRRSPHDSTDFRGDRRRMPPDSAGFRGEHRRMPPPDGRPPFHESRRDTSRSE